MYGSYSANQWNQSSRHIHNLKKWKICRFINLRIDIYSFRKLKVALQCLVHFSSPYGAEHFDFFERVDGLPWQRAYQIKAYHDIGMEQKAIAAQLGVSQSCVSKTHRCIPQTGNFSSRKRSRLSRVTSKRTDQLRRRCFLKIPTISSTEIRFSLAWLDKVPSARTLPRRHSDEFRLKAYKPVRRPRLPKKNIPDRLRFAEATRHWDVAKRRKVMFSDESTILQFENFKFSKTPGKNALSAT